MLRSLEWRMIGSLQHLIKMAHGMICPKCGKTHVGYKRPIGNPFGKGVWKCYRCGHEGEYIDFKNNKVDNPKKIKNNLRKKR